MADAMASASDASSTCSTAVAFIAPKSTTRKRWRSRSGVELAGVLGACEQPLPILAVRPLLLEVGSTDVGRDLVDARDSAPKRRR